jgi:hypothetical protein
VKSVAYHADLTEVQGDGALAALLDSPARSTPFDRLAWWRTLVDECGRAPVLVVCRDDESGHIAVLPLAHAPAPRHFVALANWYSFRVAPVVSEGAEPLPLLTALAANLARRADRVTLAPVPNEGGEADLLARAFRAAGWFVSMAECDTNHILPVAGRDYTTYLASRPGALRTTLKRKQSKVEIKIFQHFDADAWAAYEAIYAASWKPAEGSPAFLARFARDEGAAGRLRLGLAFADGRPVAAQVWTVEGDTAFIHKLAHLEEARTLSPGTSLSAALFEAVIDRDHVSLVDFGTGDDAYKRDWMEQQRPRYQLDMIRPQVMALWPQIVGACVKRLAGAIRHG